MLNDAKQALAQDSTSISANTNLSGKRMDYLSWEDYFMATALLAAKRSKDPNTQVGACIVDNEKRIIAIGYNGFPRNCSDDEFSWLKRKQTLSDIDDKHLYVVHAEANAILNKNNANIEGSCLYTTLFPCNECAKLIIQSGIRKIIYLSDEKGNELPWRAAKNMFNAAGVTCSPFQKTQQKIEICF